MASVTEVITNARNRDIPGILRHCDKALIEFRVARTSFIRRVDANLTNGFDDMRNSSDKFHLKKTGNLTERAHQEERKRRAEKLEIKMHENNPRITDLGDMNRPTRLAERFSNLYDNEWTDAFEDLRKLYNFEISGDERAILELSTILKRAFEFTQVMAEKQMINISSSMKGLMVNPTKDMKQDDNYTSLESSYDALAEVRFTRYARKCIKENAELSVPVLIQHFNWQIRRESIRDIMTIHSVKMYSNKCVQITWLMNTQDPPMNLVWAADVKHSNLLGMFRYYTRSGTKLRHEVWPALMLTSEGPLMIKGIAQFR